jgi:glycosyltransferase involved in cell wall biosynthesis
MNKLSVVIITLNEEKDIARCLNSVKDVADEIVVLDSFSTDNTKNICKNFNVNFHQHEFDGHIQQKNRAVELAKYELVFALDADEVPDSTLINEIISIKNKTDFDAYYFNRLTNYCGKWIRHSGWYPDKKLRIWNKTKGKWGGMNPHDKVIMEEGSKTKFLKGDLLHYSYYSIQQHINQINSFTNIGAKEAFKTGRKSNLFIAITKSFWKFFRDYFIKLGMLDGYYGFVICSLSAQATFIKYLKIRELIKIKI